MFLNRINNAISSTVTSVKEAYQSAPNKPHNGVSPGKPFSATQVAPFQPLIIHSDDKSDLAAVHEYNSNGFVEEAKMQGPRGGISAKMLSRQAGKLKPLESMTTPFTEHITIMRDGEYVKHKAGYQFAEFATSTRQHLTELAETYAGKRLFLALAKRDNDVPTKAMVGIQDAGPKKGCRAASEALSDGATPKLTKINGYTKLTAGAGSHSLLTHHTDIAQRWGDKSQSPAYLNTSIKQLEGNIGISAAIALGHELIHAAHSAHGYLSKEIQSNGLRVEEAITVGQKGKGSVFVRIPTENQIREDMNRDVFNNAGMVKKIKSRDTYTGKEIEPVMIHDNKKSILRD